MYVNVTLRFFFYNFGNKGLVMSFILLLARQSINVALPVKSTFISDHAKIQNKYLF